MLLGPEKVVSDTGENYAKCLCYTTRCPTYNKSKLSGGLFCARGKSERTPEKKGCICFMCPVWEEHKLNAVFFCSHGAAGECR